MVALTRTETDHPRGPALAVALADTRIEAALVTPEGSIVPGSRHRRPTGLSLDARDLSTAIDDVCGAALATTTRGTVTHAGIGAPAPIDPETGAIISVDLPDVHGISLADAVAAALRSHGVAEPSVRDGHDVGCLALAESTIGATRGTRASAAVVVSTGIGSGIVIDGTLFGGASGDAGHLGRLHPDGGEGQTLEEIASGPSSVRWARAQGWLGDTSEDLATAASVGDPVAREAIARSAAAVGCVLADVTTLIDLDMIAVSGGFSQVTGNYITMVQHQLTARVTLPYA